MSQDFNGQIAPRQRPQLCYDTSNLLIASFLRSGVVDANVISEDRPDFSMRLSASRERR